MKLGVFAATTNVFILNTDNSNFIGTHWAAVNIVDTSDAIGGGTSTYYFDSFGLEPTEEIKRYCKEPRFYNSFEFQKPNEVICGTSIFIFSSTECVFVNKISLRSCMSYTLNKIKYYYII